MVSFFDKCMRGKLKRILSSSVNDCLGLANPRDLLTYWIPLEKKRKRDLDLLEYLSTISLARRISIFGAMDWN